MRKLIAILTIIVISVFVNADPIEQNEIDEFEGMLRSFENLGPNDSKDTASIMRHFFKKLKVQKEALNKIDPNFTIAEKEPAEFDFKKVMVGYRSERHLYLAASQSLSQEYIRSLHRNIAEIYHFLGHLAEHEHSFMQAYEYNKKSLIHYSLSNNMETIGSWHGVDHAYEHMFMDLFDQAVIYERQGKLEAAKTQYLNAYKFSLLNDLEKRVGMDGRFQSRQKKLFYKVGCIALLSQR